MHYHRPPPRPSNPFVRDTLAHAAWEFQRAARSIATDLADVAWTVAIRLMARRPKR